MKKELHLAICIDGVIRDTYSQFDKMYRKRFIRNEGLVEMNDRFQYVESDDDEEEDSRIEKLMNLKIHLPVTTTDLSNHYEFNNTEEFKKFFEVDYVLEIFGSADQYRQSMETANRFQHVGKNETLFDTTLICEGNDQMVTATYHFLNKNACRIRNVKFMDFNESVWNNFDVIITDLPIILDSKPGNKFSIKVNKEYNNNSTADLIVDQLRDIQINDLLNLIEK